MNDFSRQAARVLNSPYWYARYPGADPDECVRFYGARVAEKSALAAECARVESTSCDLGDMVPGARASWDRAAATMAPAAATAGSAPRSPQGGPPARP